MMLLQSDSATVNDRLLHVVENEETFRLLDASGLFGAGTLYFDDQKAFACFFASSSSPFFDYKRVSLYLHALLSYEVKMEMAGES